MKKLIAMIGAVATAFGLYADPVAPFAISFEGAEDAMGIGVDTSSMTFTPGTDWSWSGDPLSLKAYAGDAFEYGTGALARRDGFADQGLSQANYLTLETGTNALSRTVAEGQIFLDQLVKFTGFEEYQTNVVAGTKIAVWMSGIEQEGTPAVPGNGEPEFIDDTSVEPDEEGKYPQIPNPDYVADIPASSDYIAGETNLYITVGKDNGGTIEPIALKIDGDNYKLDTWYRLTIKSIGDIFGGAEFTTPRAGFIVYINGEQAKCSAPVAKELVSNQGSMSAVAKGYMDEGQLFPAIDNSDATFATVGYQGIGAIDDIVLDADGPEFAQTIEIEPEWFALPEEVEIASVTVGGVEIPLTDGKYVVKPGDTVVVTFKAGDGFFANPSSKTFENVSKDTDFDVSGEIEVEAAAVIVTINDNDPVYYMSLTDAYAELAGNIGHDDTVAIEIFSQTLLEIEEQPIYELNANTTINIYPAGQDYPAGAWEVLIGDYEEGEEEEVTTVPGTASNNLGAMPGKTMLVSFTGDDDEELNDGRMFNLQGNIYGYGEDETLIQVAGNTVLTGDLTIGAACDGASTGNCGATLKTDAIDVSGNQITLVGKGKVITLADSGLTADDFIVDGELDISDPDEDGYITYSVAQSEPAVAVAIVVSADGVTTNEFTDLAAAIAAAQAGETVALLDNVEVGATIALNTAITLDLGGKTLTRATGAEGFMFTAAADVDIVNGAIDGGAAKVLDVLENGDVLFDDISVTAATHGFLNVYAGKLTVGANAVVSSAKAAVYMGAEVNVYGKIERIYDPQEYPLFWVDSGSLNVYDGATVQCGKGDVVRSNEGSAVINIYGGTVSVASTDSGYPVIYCYSSSEATVNFIGGTVIGAMGMQGASKIASLGADCQTKFSSTGKVWGGTISIADACAEGYGLKLVDGWYEIAQLPVVELVKAGNKGTVTLDQTIGTSVAFGGTVSGTVTANEGYTPFVFVDGQKVAVGQDGAFEGIANNSGKVVVAYAKESAWYMDPFVKNTFINFSNTYAPGDFTLTEDEQYLFMISSRAGDGGTYMKQYSVEEFADTFGYEEPTTLASSAMKTYPTGFMGVAGIAASTAAGYAFSGSAYGLVDTLKDRTVAWPFNGKWDPAAEDRVVLTSDIPNTWQRMAPLVVSLDGKYVYANNYYQPYIYKLAIVKDEQSGAITGLQYTGNVWVLPDAARATAMTIGQVGGKEIIWASSNTKFFAFEPSAAAVGTVEAPVTNNLAAAGTHGYAFRQISVTGKEDGLLHLIGSIQDGVVAVFPITDDGFALAAETPITVLEKTNFCNGKGFQGFVALDDESMAFGQNIHPTLNVTQSAYSYVKKPANLIVRGKFVTDEEVAQPEDIMPAFGAAVGKTYEAPTGYKITDVTVNGEAVAGFVAGSSFNFTNDALTAYTLVKMSLEALPPVANVTISEVVTPYYDLHDALVAGSVSGAKVELLDNVDLTSVAWEPIANFAGTFDGAGYTISNLSIAQEADFAGFIAKASGNNNDKSKPAVIKNVTFENVTVMAPAQSYVAAVVAECTANVVISNVAVTGTIKIDGKKYVAAIAGHGYVAKIVDCTVDGLDNDESFIKGSDAGSYQIGGIMGMTSEGSNPIFGCSVKNVTISGNRIVGGIAGRCKEGNQIVGCSVENVILKSDAPTLGAMIGQRLEEGSSVNVLLNYEQTGTVLKGTDDTTKDFAWYGDKSGNINYIYSQNAVGDALVAGASNYALTAGDYTLEGEGALAELTAQCAAGYAPIANQDGTYTIKQVWDVTFYVGEVVSNAQVVVNGECAKEFAYDTETIEAWTNAAGVAFAFTTPITEATTLYAQLKATGPTWPQDWPGDADEKVVEKFATWSAANPGVDFTSEAVQNAFLMGVNADATIPTLKIESIAVEGDTATIVVSAEGVNLETGINGVLYVDGTNELGAEWATTEVEIGSAAQFTEGKATFTVPNAKFMKAGVGFKAPAVEPVTD